MSVSRSNVRYHSLLLDDEAALCATLIRLAHKHGRYGYRRVTALLRRDGWRVNHKRVERLWRREGLQVPPKQPKRGRLYLNDGSCVRLRPAFRHHVWTYDFMMDRTRTGTPLKFLNIVDEYSRECLAIVVEKQLKSDDVIATLSGLFVKYGVPNYLRSDNGSEFTATPVRKWLDKLGTKPLFIEPGSPWENGYIESFNGKMRDEFLNREVFDTVLEAKVLTEAWRTEYNTVRPHSSLGYRPPAPLAMLLENRALVSTRLAG